MKNLILLLLLSYSLPSQARQVQDTFVVDIYDNFVRVVSPDKITKSMVAIVNNRTLTKIYGHVQSPEGNWKSYFSLKSEKTISLNLKTEDFKKFVLFSLAPPFQEVWLIPGQKVYEIPPRQKTSPLVTSAKRGN